MTDIEEHQSFREYLDGGCSNCGKSKQSANELAPIVHGRYVWGPDWRCGECMDARVAAVGGNDET